MRFLDSKGVSYDVFNFPDTIHAAQDVAAHIGVATSEVYKTLVLMTAKQTPILVMVPADPAAMSQPLRIVATASGSHTTYLACQ